MRFIDLSAPITSDPPDTPDALRTEIEFAAHSDGARAIKEMLGVGPERALELVAQARGLPVPDNEAQRDWLYQFALNHGG